MEKQKEHFRHIMFYYFNKGKNAAQTSKKIMDVYGKGAVKERVCQKWFTKFRSGNFTLQDAPRSGRPQEIDNNQVKSLIDTNPHFTTREIAEILKVSKSSVDNRLHQLGYIRRLDVWVPNAFSGNASSFLQTEQPDEEELMKRKNEQDLNCLTNKKHLTDPLSTTAKRPRIEEDCLSNSTLRDKLSQDGRLSSQADEILIFINSITSQMKTLPKYICKPLVRQVLSLIDSRMSTSSFCERYPIEEVTVKCEIDIEESIVAVKEEVLDEV